MSDEDESKPPSPWKKGAKSLYFTMLLGGFLPAILKPSFGSSFAGLSAIIVMFISFLVGYLRYKKFQRKSKKYDRKKAKSMYYCDHKFIKKDFVYKCDKCGKSKSREMKSIEKLKSSGPPYELFARFSHYGLQAGGTLSKVEIGNSGLEIKQQGKSKEFVSYGTISNLTRRSTNYVEYETNTSTVWGGHIAFQSEEKTDFAVRCIKLAMSGELGGEEGKSEENNKSSGVEEIEKYYELMKEGAISEEEYRKQKRKILGNE